MIREKLQRFMKAEDGIGTLEILLIIAVIVIIAIAFRKWIMAWVKKLFENADGVIKSDKLDSDSLLPSSTP